MTDREIDALVHQHLFGETHTNPPHYTTDWTLAPYIMAAVGGYGAIHFAEADTFAWVGGPKRDAMAYDTNPLRALCLAALKSKEVSL